MSRNIYCHGLSIYILSWGRTFAYELRLNCNSLNKKIKCLFPTVSKIHWALTFFFYYASTTRPEVYFMAFHTCSHCSQRDFSVGALVFPHFCADILRHSIVDNLKVSLLVLVKGSACSRRCEVCPPCPTPSSPPSTGLGASPKGYSCSVGA